MDGATAFALNVKLFLKLMNQEHKRAECQSQNFRVFSSKRKSVTVVQDFRRIWRQLMRHGLIWWRMVTFLVSDVTTRKFSAHHFSLGLKSRPTKPLFTLPPFRFPHAHEHMASAFRKPHPHSQGPLHQWPIPVRATCVSPRKQHTSPQLNKHTDFRHLNCLPGTLEHCVGFWIHGKNNYIAGEGAVK